MRGIAGQIEPPILHRLHHKASHTCNAFLQDCAFRQLPAVARSQASAKLTPDLLVAPAADVFIWIALQVEAADLRRAHAQQREAVFVMGVNQFVRGGRRLRQNAEPAKRIDALVLREHAGGQAGAADAMKTVATSDEVALKLIVGAVLAIESMRS